MLNLRKARNLQQNGSIQILMVILCLLGIVALVGYRILGTTDKAMPVSSRVDMPDAPFVFLAAGDFSDNTNADNVLRKMGETSSDFVLALGDLSYGVKGNEAAWCKFVRERVPHTTPFQLIVGNHDDGEGEISDIRNFTSCLPDMMSSVGDYDIEYYFDYEDIARFIMIAPDIDQYGFDYSRGLPHYEWVRERIREARSAGASWVVLGMHKNCITPGVKSCEIGEDLLNLAIEEGVDLILQGHEHAYFRSKQIAQSSSCPILRANIFDLACVAGDGGVFRKGAGSLIVISGAGGHPIRDANLSDQEIEYFEAIDGANTGNTYGFSRFVVTKNKIESQFVSASDGDFEDTFVIE